MSIFAGVVVLAGRVPVDRQPRFERFAKIQVGVQHGIDLH
jgi:hypothetical protein